MRTRIARSFNLTTLLPDIKKSLFWPWVVLLLLGQLAAVHSAHAQNLILDGSQPKIELQPYIDYLRDPSAQLQLAQAMERRADFISAAPRKDLNFGYTHDHIWLTFQLESQEQHTRDWFIEFDYPTLDWLELHSLGPEGSEVQYSGDILRYAERSIGHRTPAFSIRLQPGEQRTIYLLVHSQGSLTLDANLWRDDAFREHSNLSYVMLSLYFGMLIALGCYNLLLFLSVRERPFLLYALFVFAFGASVLAFTGLGAQYLWPDAGPLGNRVLPFSLCLSSTISILFTQSFLNTAKQALLWHRLLSVAALLTFVTSLTTLIVNVQLALQLMSASGILTTLLLFTCSIHCMSRKIPGARIFVFAWTLLLSGALLLALRNFGLVPSNFVTINAMQIGSAMEMLLLSFGLATRFNELKRLKELAQSSALSAQRQVVHALQQHERILEQRVQERTEALAAANQRLEELAMRDTLTGLANRAALARHLQKALPRVQRRGDGLAVILVDLDDFKLINDEFGHDCGDQVLCEVARRLQQCARESDLVTRFGGDEFILVSEGVANAQAAMQFGQRLMDTLSQPIQLPHGSVTIGASIGISLSDGSQDSDHLIRQADQAMYQRKRSGRNGVDIISSLGAGTPQPSA